jgi:hypothetical protein
MTIENANVAGISGSIYVSVIKTSMGGAGIGTGSGEGSHVSTIGRVTIKNATASGSSSGDRSGAGIGTGSVYLGGDTGVGTMTIEDSNVTGTVSGGGGSGIGTGWTQSGNTAIGSLLLSRVRAVCSSLRAPNISVSNAWIFAPNPGLFQAAPTVSGALTLFYGNAANAAQESKLAGVPHLSIGSLSLPVEGGWRFCISGQDCSPYFSEVIRGVFALVPSPGSYSVVAEGPLKGLLGPSEGSNSFGVSASGSFYSVAYFIGPTPTPSEAFVEGEFIAGLELQTIKDLMRHLHLKFKT